MIYDVKVYTPDGTVKEIITAKTLKKKFLKDMGLSKKFMLFLMASIQIFM